MIDLVPHRPQWADAYAEEAEAVRAAFGPTPVRLYHIGSTAVPDLIAKPIIDLLGAVPNLGALDNGQVDLAALGYVSMGAYGVPGRRFYRKHDATGARSHHLHIYAEGARDIDRHLAFRDYLRTHPEARAAYAMTKQSARAQGSASRADYQDAKSPFVAAMEAEALRWWATEAP